MNTDTLTDIAKETITMMLMVSAPVMVSSFIIGLVMSFLQAIFQIHEYTFSFVPKLIVILVSIVIAAPWMIQLMVGFSRGYLGGYYRYIH